MSEKKGPRRHVRFDSKKLQPDAAPNAPGGPDGKRPKAEFKITEQSQSGSKLWVVMGLAAVLGLSAYAAMNMSEKPDPHYVKADRMVTEYQSGRAATDRNYNNPIYDQALEELDLVDPESISVEPAAELREDILHGRESFLARRDESTRGTGVDQTKRQERKQRNLEAYRRAKANPVTEYKECEDEEGDGHSH